MVSHFVGTTHFFVFSFSLVDVPAETHGKKLTLEHKGTRTAAKRRLKRQLAVDQVFENLGAERERGAGPAPPEAPLPFVSAPFPDVSLFLLFLIFFFFFLSLSLPSSSVILFFYLQLLLPVQNVFAFVVLIHGTAIRFPPNPTGPARHDVA